MASAVKGLSTENALAVLSQTALNNEQIKAILVIKGLKGEELELAMATLAQDAANKTATGSTFSLTAALQGLKTAVLTNPLLMATAVAAGLFAVYKVVDLLTVSFEEQKESTHLGCFYIQLFSKLYFMQGGDGDR